MRIAGDAPFYCEVPDDGNWWQVVYVGHYWQRKLLASRKGVKSGMLYILNLCLETSLHNSPLVPMLLQNGNLYNHRTYVLLSSIVPMLMISVRAALNYIDPKSSKNLSSWSWLAKVGLVHHVST